MKLSVKVDDQIFEVEVDNLHTRPILVRVDGQVFEIMPEAEKSLTDEEKLSASLSSPVPRSGPKAPPLSRPSETDRAVFAPIPGVIEKIMVREGDVVQRGQEMIILEAMKMKNAIRSPRDGRIAAIPVAVGDTVNHNDTLIEYGD